jgi:hypothetical protein
LENKINTALNHATWGLAAIFTFYSIIFTANTLKIPFYLGYKMFIINIMLFTPIIDKLVWACSLTAFATLLFIQCMRNDIKGLRLFATILYGLVLTSLAYGLWSSFNILGIILSVVSGIFFMIFFVSCGGKLFDEGKAPIILLIFYSMLILLGVELASFMRWTYNMFFPSLVFNDESWSAAFTEVQISNILYPFLPFLLMIFIFSWTGEFTIKNLLTRNKNFKQENNLSPQLKSLKLPLMIALISVAAGLFVNYYNFSISNFFNSAFPGTDVHYYIKYLNDMLSENVIGALGYAAQNERFLYLIFQHICFLFSGSPLNVFVTFIMPAILTFLLILSFFVFVKAGRDFLHSATAMLVAVFSFQVTVGFYAGFYANWFALVLTNIFYGLLFFSYKKRSKSWLMVFIILAPVAVLFIHLWTWIFIMMISLAYFLVTLLLIWIRKKNFHEYVWELKFLTLILIVNLVMFYVRDLFGVGREGMKVVHLTMMEVSPAFSNILNLKYFLDLTFNWYVGGFYASVPIILLAIFGIFSFLDYEDRYNRLLLTWVLVTSAMIFVNFPWHARFLYLVPFSAYAAFGILHGAKQLYETASTSGLKYVAPIIFWVFYALSILLLFNYAIRSVVLKQLGPMGLVAIS